MDFPAQTLAAVLRWRLEDASDGVAYHVEVQPGRYEPISYADSRHETLSAAAALRASGVARGDRVAVLAEVRPEWVLSDFATLLLGAVTVGIYPNCTDEQVAYQLDHSEAKVLILTDEAAQRLGSVLAGRDIRLVVLGERAPNGARTWAEFVADGSEALARIGEAALIAEVDLTQPDDLAALVYTSGTTGPPKGAMLTHGNLYWACEAVRRTLPLGPDDRSVVFLPLAHVLQRYTVYLGAMTGIHGYFLGDIPRLGEVLPVARPTVLVVVPRVLEKVHAKALAAAQGLSPFRRAVFHWAFRVGDQAATAEREGRPVGTMLALQRRIADRLVFRKVRQRLGGSVRMVVSGGAPLAPELARWFHAAGLPVLEGYGLTETSAPATTNLPDAWKIGTVGRPIADTDVRIAEDGEIEIRGPGVFTGYFRDDDATASVFTDDGYFRSGDIGEIDGDGFLRITDRKKHILITAGGKNVAPANVENRLKQHPLVGQAMLAGDRRPYLVALLTLDPETVGDWCRDQGLGELTLAEASGHDAVRAAVDAHVVSVSAGLARHEAPKKWALLDVPFEPENGYLTPTLKLKRKAILADYGARIDALYER